MTPPRPTVAEVVRSILDEFLEGDGPWLTPEQRRTLNDLATCRTAALGGHVLECPVCGYQQIAYNSCGDRHCPTCQATAAARWLEARAAELLPVPYFHLVFTLPDVLNPLALAHPRVVYDLLLRCCRRDDPRTGRRSGPPRRPDRRRVRAAHLGPDAPVPSARPLPGAGRRPVPGPDVVGRLTPPLLPAGAGAQPGLPRQVLGWAARGVHPRTTADRWSGRRRGGG